MFGYVRICQKELSEADLNEFKEYYCGLCKEIGRYSNFARLGLSFDMTFLLILLSSLCREEISTKKTRCVLHPFKKRNVKEHNEILEYVANMSIVLSYKKLEDDLKDEKSLKAFLGKILYFRGFKKAKNKFPHQEKEIEKMLLKLSALERENSGEIDAVADCFAKICECIFNPPFIRDENTKKILSWLGYNIGRWIYLIDAFDDLDKDIKDNAYNPFKKRLNEGNFTKEELKKETNITLTYTLANIAGAYDLLSIERNDKILKNILYSGLRGVQADILKIQEDEDESV